jgi:capsid portal protein
MTKRRIRKDEPAVPAIQADNEYALRSVLIGGETSRADARDESQQLDPFSQLYKQGDVISPPYPPLEMSMLPEHSDILGAIIDALAVNIDGQGHRMVAYPDVDEDSPDVQEEKARTEAFFDSCSSEGFTQLRMDKRRDQEPIGYAFFEVLRETFTSARARRQRKAQNRVELGLPAMRVEDDGDERHPWRFVHVPAYTVRLCALKDEDGEPVEAIEYRRLEGRWEKETVRRTFRKFVQILSENPSKKRYFREFGDPRGMDADTGKYYDSEDAVPQGKTRATELAYFRHKSGRTPYGISPFAGVMLNIAGTRKTQELNYSRLRNNMIPPLFLLISGGGLTKGSVQRMEEKLKEMKGLDRFSAIMLLEALAPKPKGKDLLEPSGPAGAVKIEVKEVAQSVPGDALFMKYTEANHKIIRARRRVPPILIGLAEDYSYATAFVSLKMFDEQVCDPERGSFDAWVNGQVLPRLGIHDWRFQSNGITTGQMAEVAKLIEAGAKVGVGDPNKWGEVIGDQLGVTFDKNEDWDGTPWEMVMSREAGQNVAGSPTVFSATFQRGEEDEEAFTERLVARVSTALVEGAKRYHAAAEGQEDA